MKRMRNTRGNTRAVQFHRLDPLNQEHDYSWKVDIRYCPFECFILARLVSSGSESMLLKTGLVFRLQFEKSAITQKTMVIPLSLSDNSITIQVLLLKAGSVCLRHRTANITMTYRV